MTESELSETDRIRHAGTFGAAAAAYERGRPTYPDEAVDWLLELLPAPEARVCDLGAGTGKLTRSLVGRGLGVTAVEPAPEMLAVLSSRVPKAAPQLGTAESTGLADASMDAVLMAQAWHWVDPPQATGEVARVLRDGGSLGLLWNLRTDTTPFARELESLLGGSDDFRWSHVDPSSLPDSPFEPGEQHAVKWTFDLDPAGLVDMVASRSYVIAMEVEPRKQLLARVDDLARRYAEDGVVRVPYQTRCFRYRRRDR